MNLYPHLKDEILLLLCDISSTYQPALKKLLCVAHTGPQTVVKSTYIWASIHTLYVIIILTMLDHSSDNIYVFNQGKLIMHVESSCEINRRQYERSVRSVGPCSLDCISLYSCYTSPKIYLLSYAHLSFPSTNKKRSV